MELGSAVTMTQPSLFDQTDDDTYTLEWNEYRKNHPEVWKDIVRRALHKARYEGAKRISVKGIVEGIREHGIPTSPDAVVAIDNSCTAVIARQLVAEYPELKDIVRTRIRRVK